MANVLIPSLVKLHFPDRIGPMTALYTTALAVGLTAAFVLTVPLAEAFGAGAPGSASGPSSPAVAALPWLGLASHDQRTRARRRAPSASATSRAPGSAGRWRCSSGSSRSRPTPSSAGSRPSGATPASAPRRPARWSGWWPPRRSRCRCGLPQAVARPGNQRWVLFGVMLLYPVAYVGLVVAPHALAILWAVVAGRRDDDLPDGAHAHRAARRHARAHRRALRLHPVDRLPAGRDRAVRRRRAARGDAAAGRCRCGAAGAGVPLFWLGRTSPSRATIEDQLGVSATAPRPTRTRRWPSSAGRRCRPMLLPPGK